jgi:hypothetical protein
MLQNRPIIPLPRGVLKRAGLTYANRHERPTTDKVSSQSASSGRNTAELSVAIQLILVNERQAHC